MTESAAPRPTPMPGTSVSDVLRAMGQLMGDCHHECLALQEAISPTPPAPGVYDRHLAVYQNLDHMTQVHEDLSRLLPELARAIDRGTGPVDQLADALRLISLRHRLFGYDKETPSGVDLPGDVNFL